jgi:hypothetical protein
MVEKKGAGRPFSMGAVRLNDCRCRC